MTIEPSIFRAYDIRGIADRDLTETTIYQIGQALGSFVIEQHQSYVHFARDGRLSSPKLAKAFLAGICATGCDVIDHGEWPTPLLYFAVHQDLHNKSGVMLTGSHNSGEYNGLKMIVNGITLSAETIQHLYQRIQQQQFFYGNGTIITGKNLFERYQQAIRENITLTQTFKIVVDCGHGIMGKVAPDIFRALGCEVIPLYCEVDGNFPVHHPDPSRPENLRDLLHAIHQHQADLGFAFDGDGDRIGVVTKEGEIIQPDRLLMGFAKSLLKKHPQAKVVFDVKCSRDLAHLVQSEGGEAIIWKTGHSLIKAKMKETNALLGGEMSGHLYFADRWAGFDDGFYAAVRLLEILQTYPSPEIFFAELPQRYSTPELIIPVPEEKKFSLINQIVDEAKQLFSQAKLITLDGIRIEFDYGWGLVRASNTSPALVLRFEADSEPNLSLIQALFNRLMTQVH